METNELNYYFKVREPEDIALNISVIDKDLGYNGIDKSNVFASYNINKACVNGKLKVENILSSVKDVCDKQYELMTEMCNKLQQKWGNYREEYLSIIEKCLGINFNREMIYNTYCYLHLLPINQVDLSTKIVYLSYNEDIEQLFKNFIILLTKSIVLDRWNYLCRPAFDTEFDYQNKLWLFIEIAIDAIFSNSDLSKICAQPSYKYFYSIKLNDINIMERFRQLHKLISIDDFFNEVFTFVYENATTLLKFKNYLY